MLDARLSFQGVGVSARKRQERNAEALEAFLALCEIARQRKADALVIAGNLWDSVSVTAMTVSKVVDAFAALGDIPVVICPGRADPFNNHSLYNPKVLAAYAVKPWSKNVQIFSEPHFSFWLHPSRPDYSFTGRAWVGQPVARPDFYPAVEGRTNMLLDYEPPLGYGSDSPASLAEQRKYEAFRYIAFGGTPNFRELRRADGLLRGLGAGSLVVRSISELGPRNALWVELSNEQEQQRIRIDRLVSDARQLLSVPVNINGVRNINEHIARAIEAAGAREKIDLVHVRLSGIYPGGSVPEIGEDELAKRYYHLMIENRTRPDYAVEKIDTRTTSGRFVQAMQVLKHKAEAKGGVLVGTEYGDNLSARTIEDALYIGLEALHHKKVNLPDVN